MLTLPIVRGMCRRGVGLIMMGGGILALQGSIAQIDGNFKPFSTTKKLPPIPKQVTPTDDGVYHPASSFVLDPTDSKGLSLRNAWYLAHLSRVAYLEEKGARNRCVELGYSPSSFKWFAKRADAESGLNHDTQSFVAAHDDHILVTFRGTTSGADWATNIDIFTCKTPHGGIHSGFSEAVDTVWKRMLPAINDLRKKSPEKPIFVCGHSLGAALASVATARLVLDENIPVQGLYTIGSPRVFLENFAATFDKVMKDKDFRTVNNNDVVTRVPFDVRILNMVGLNFEHVGTEVYINRRGNLGGRSFFDSIAGRFEALLGRTISDGVADHSCYNYEELLRNLAAKASKHPILKAKDKVIDTVKEILPLKSATSKDHEVLDLAKDVSNKMAEPGIKEKM